MRCEMTTRTSKFPLNDDLTAITMSYLDITEYIPTERDELFAQFGSDNHEKIMSFWWKESNCTEEKRTTGRIDRKVNRKLHCEDGPATIWPDGSTEWWINDKLHREGGPAVSYIGGDDEWWRHGELHREGGPAIVHADGTRSWLLNGTLHREDGPAVEHADGTLEWWINDEMVSTTGPQRRDISEDEYKFIDSFFN